MTVGRNDLCPCGSGKKYKKCCQPKQEVISLAEARTENLYRAVFDKLSEFMGRGAAEDVIDAAFAQFFAAPIPEEELAKTAEMAMDWVTFGYRTADGTAMCEQLADSGKGLTDQERDLLRAWAASAPGYFRVESAAGRDCQLRRLPDGQLFPVRTPNPLKPGALVAGWLLPVHDSFRFGYLIQDLDESMLDPLMHLVTVEMELLRRQRPAATWDELCREHWPRLTDALTIAMVDGEKALSVPLPAGPAVLTADDPAVGAGLNWEAVEDSLRTADAEMSHWLDQQDIEGVLRLWRDGALALRPRVTRPALWAGAVAYVYVHDVFGDEVTQTEVAEAWGMAPATLRKYAGELAHALKPQDLDPRYISLMDPLVRVEWRRSVLGLPDEDDWEPWMDENDWDDEDDEPITLALTDRTLMERALRGAAGGVMSERPAGPIREAEELIDQAWDASGLRRTRLAEQAIKRWPDAADAYVILGQAAQERGDLRAAVRQFQAGVKAGERALGAEFFAENVGHFYGLVESRPYMRARAGLATCLWALDEREAAVAHYEEMLRLNPGDNQGMRYLLASCYLMMGEDARLGSLLAENADEPTANIGFTRALWEFRRSGPGPAADKLLAKAVAANPHVAAYLLGKKRLPAEPPAYVGFGDSLEAQGYAWNFGEGWKATKGALEWLRSRTR